MIPLALPCRWDTGFLFIGQRSRPKACKSLGIGLAQATCGSMFADAEDDIVG